MPICTKCGNEMKFYGIDKKTGKIKYFKCPKCD
jgi:DNA-directed RNA polymerase subunit RPC12/RpoP